PVDPFTPAVPELAAGITTPDAVVVATGALSWGEVPFDTVPVAGAACDTAAPLAVCPAAPRSSSAVETPRPVIKAARTQFVVRLRRRMPSVRTAVARLG